MYLHSGQGFTSEAERAAVGESPEVKDFMTRSSQAWGEALRATGADEADVAAKVAATTAFYVPPAE